MTITAVAGGREHGRPDLLDRERIIAEAGFNRWVVPPAALAIHLCIGMAYGFSVFWLPLSRAVGITAPKACAIGFTQALFDTGCDWKVSDLGWIFTLFFVVLGSSAALWGGWLERAGPRKAGVVAAFCWSGGLLIGAIGIATHQLWLLLVGPGIIGGIGLGLGYISPVSTLIKWFPDRRGTATGMAIMGFGGGAMIGAPLANLLMDHFKTTDAVGVWQTFVALALIYFVAMMAGALFYRLPPAGWRPDGLPVALAAKSSMITTRNVHLKNAHKTPQFWLIWAVLCLNVSAGIGVLGMASPMLQEIFGGRLLGLPDLSFTQLDPTQKTAIAAIAAGFTGLLSLFNIGGRFFWAAMSDKIGRKTTYFIFFAFGIVLYASGPWAAHAGSKALFVGIFCVILSMYGGGFATVPAYLADIFGTQFVGAIHGRLLTAWSTAGIIGPVVVNYIREAQIAAGVPRDQVYDRTMYILAGMLVLGFIANSLVRPLADHWFMKDSEVAALQPNRATPASATGSFGIGFGGFDARAAIAWALVGVPLLWGVWQTLSKALILFR
ncbi:OFA family MFS transporter [Lichenifustis flavocetrariae]|uniref:OFA family MFS transporter n=1 Tax=Lichenifustis flavocetrariae TaxID=2949735 RepID=A0AA41Z414_9HYPH|nr:OFA family MFS transporter [Lichenifustis flavocetrariae]MCW6510088.1 OFA family MFS transporter [Lichenifustis flavocetrariae]